MLQSKKEMSWGCLMPTLTVESNAELVQQLYGGLNDGLENLLQAILLGNGTLQQLHSEHSRTATRFNQFLAGKQDEVELKEKHILFESQNETFKKTLAETQRKLDEAHEVHRKLTHAHEALQKRTTAMKVKQKQQKQHESVTQAKYERLDMKYKNDMKLLRSEGEKIKKECKNLKKVNKQQFKEVEQLKTISEQQLKDLALKQRQINNYEKTRRETKATMEGTVKKLKNEWKAKHEAQLEKHKLAENAQKLKYEATLTTHKLDVKAANERATKYRKVAETETRRNATLTSAMVKNSKTKWTQTKSFQHDAKCHISGKSDEFDMNDTVDVVYRADGGSVHTQKMDTNGTNQALVQEEVASDGNDTDCASEEAVHMGANDVYQEQEADTQERSVEEQDEANADGVMPSEIEHSSSEEEDMNYSKSDGEISDEDTKDGNIEVELDSETNSDYMDDDKVHELVNFIEAESVSNDGKESKHQCRACKIWKVPFAYSRSQNRKIAGGARGKCKWCLEAKNERSCVKADQQKWVRQGHDERERRNRFGYCICVAESRAKYEKTGIYTFETF